MSDITNYLIARKKGGGGGSSVTVESLTVTENGTTVAPTGKAYSPVIVNVSGGGGQDVPEKDVNFIDYDGTVLYSYTAQEALALTALPANPSHEGLTAQGWNYTLAEVKTEVNAVGGTTVGQVYITDDGKTRFYIHFPKNAPEEALGCEVVFLASEANNTIIDWGDGNSETAGKLEPDAYTHYYTVPGDYIITFTVTSGNIMGDGPLIYDYYANDALYKVEIGNGFLLSSNMFEERCIKSITIPNTITSIGDYVFSNCRFINSITIPNSVVTLGETTFAGSNISKVSIPCSIAEIPIECFQYCKILKNVVIPSSVTSMQSSAFEYCDNLNYIIMSNNVELIGISTFHSCRIVNIVIPSAISKIDSEAFCNCSYAREYHIKPTTPPTIAADTFESVSSDCKFYVPAASLSAYQTATNWSALASQMVGE